MLRSLMRSIFACGLCAVMAQACLAQQTPKVSLETSETIFSVMAAINACGYDQELGVSAPVRQEMRAAVAKNLQSSDEGRRAVEELCTFYREHTQGDASRELAQYLSLALNLGPPPAFHPSMRESDLPPDTSYILGVLPLLQRFYKTAGLHAIWENNRPEYEALVARLHQPVTNLLLKTDIYLKLPISGYVGRRMVIYVEPLAAPGQVNARNYGDNYFLVMSPVHGSLKMDQVRHTYLHFVLDPLALKRANTIKKMSPLLNLVKNAPMDESYKNDMGLLMMESLIRAIEAHMQYPARTQEEARRQAVDASMAQGFILTRYFSDQLDEFEKTPVGLRDAFPDWLYYLDIEREKKRTAELVFASSAAPDVVHASKTQEPQLVNQAEARLAAGDLGGAQQLAQQALDKKQGDAGRAYFVLAKAASLNKDMPGARNYFERAVQAARDPHVLAWSHIYLGRISDLQGERQAAVAHYRAALTAGDNAPETKGAAQGGLEKPYEPPQKKEQ